MKQGIAKFKSEIEKKEFVKNEDAAFEKRLNGAIERIVHNGKLRVILLSGPSGSGKTTASEKISKKFAEFGKRLVFVAIDDFYLDKEENARRAAAEGREAEHESVKSIDLDALAEFAREIELGEKGYVPRFSFAEGRRIGKREVDLSGEPVVLLEGIQAVYPEVEALFMHLECAELFIRPMGQLQCGGRIFDCDELRMFRRIVRNCLQRGSTAEKELEMWKTVRDNEEKNIFTQIHERVICVDSMHAYGVNMLKPMLARYLADVSASSPYKAYANDIIGRLEDIEPIDRGYLAIGSLFCEFVY